MVTPVAQGEGEPRGEGTRFTSRPPSGWKALDAETELDPGFDNAVTRKLLAAAALYVVVVLTPLGVILLGETSPERSFAIEFGVALGFIGLAMLGLQSVLTARFPRVSHGLGQDTLLQFHRQAGIVAFSLVLAHPVVLISANTAYWEFLDPRVNLLRALALITVVVALPTLIVTSLWRQQLRIPYQWWRLTHGGMAVLIVLIGIVHIFRVQYFLSEPLKQALWISLAVAAIFSVLYVRVLKLLRVRRHPYRVVAVSATAPRIWSLVVEPEHGAALAFRAGQFGLLTIADTPFSLEQHPFTFASSARRRDRLEFVIKELGDFTERIGEVPVGARAYLEGPYGALTLPDDPRSPGSFFVAGGIGITPIMSMTRTLFDEGRRHRVVLIYANDRPGDVAFAGELELLEQDPRLDLRVVQVLRDPPSDWAGETGLVDAELLARYVPDEEADQWHYVLCGPPPMMEAAESALLAMGIPLAQIDSERFDIGAAGAIGPRQAQVRRLVIALGVVMVIAAVLFAGA